MPTLNLSEEEAEVLRSFMQRLADDETMADHDTLANIERKTARLTR